MILGFLTILKNCQASSKFEAVKSTWLSSCQSHVDRVVFMEPMQRKLASSQFDFGYNEQFCIPGVKSVFFSPGDSVVGYSMQFNQANRSSLWV